MTHPIRFLFRYRDLVAKTLEEHEAILNASAGRGCWWGWWKRPHEDARDEVWEALNGDIAGHGKVRIGLFDSGAADHIAVRAVWIDKVIPPASGGGSSLAAVPLDAKDMDLVPPYYRNSPFSRAWFHIVELEPDPLDFFGTHSHRRPPPLPNYSSGALNQLAGKVVMDAAELRSMDCTIWEIRPIEEGDRREKLLFPSPYLEPIAAVPVAVRGDTILHLTDMHFSVGAHRKQHAWRLESEMPGPKSLAEAIGIATNDAGVAVLMITGDFSFVADPNEFAEAATSISRLMGILGLGLEQVIVIPGNHDLKWTKDAAATYAPGVEITQSPPEAKAAYRDFFSKLLRVDAHGTLAMARRYVFPHGGLVEIGGVNSSSLEQGQNFLSGMGRVRGGGFEQIADSLGWKDGAANHALRILGLHHHLMSTEDLESPAEYSKGFGMAIDAKNTQRLCARHGVHLVIHGHRHRSFIGRTSVCELPEEANDRWTLGDVSIVGGGSAGSTEVVANTNFFALLKISTSKVEVGFHRSKDRDHFNEKASSSWFAPLILSGGRLTLGAWSTTDPEVQK